MCVEADLTYRPYIELGTHILWVPSPSNNSLAEASPILNGLAITARPAGRQRAAHWPSAAVPASKCAVPVGPSSSPLGGAD